MWAHTQVLLQGEAKAQDAARCVQVGGDLLIAHVSSHGATSKAPFKCRI